MSDRSQLIEQALGVPAEAPRITAKPPLDRRSLIDQALGGAEPARPSPISPPRVVGQPKREIVVPGGSQAPSRGFLERTTLDPAERLAQALEFFPFGPDRRLAENLWGFTPEQLGQDILEYTQPALGETGGAFAGAAAHTFRELMTPLNMALMGLPVGAAAIRRLLPQAPVSGLPSEMA